MSSNTEKTREEILAERQEKKKRKAAMKNQPKEKNLNSKKESDDNNKQHKESSKVSEGTGVSDSVSLESGTDKKKKTQSNNNESFKLNSNDAKECNVAVDKSKKLTDSVKTSSSDKALESKEKIDNCNENVTKTKAQLKAERRAKQEAERAKKLEKSQGVSQEKKVVASSAKIHSVKEEKTIIPVSKPNHKVKLFAHLYNTADFDTVDTSNKIHPVIVQLGTQYSTKVVSGANARCLALLSALKRVVMDFETPPDQEFGRGLEAEISKSVSYLSKCRPIAVSMTNAVKHLKFQISQSQGNELKCKNDINDWIDTYIREQLEMAAKAISLFVREKISSGDIILTYGCSSLIQQILISAHNEGINFQVIVADGRPWLEGREMLRNLVRAGIRCTYVFVNGLSFIMPEVTKILLGAHAILANGYVMSRAGSSQVALLAKTYNVPVLVCCETHKFSERVQTDSFVYNELGDPDDLVSNKGNTSKELSKWKSIQFLTPLNLTYDVTPPDLISAVVTEIAVLPCTSVPVILRIKPPDIAC